jgi:hypothetical protein
LKLLLDHNLAPRIAHALNALYHRQHEIVALRDKFDADTADVTWITALDQDRGWAVLTRDLHLTTRPHERTALDRARIVFFFLAGSWKNFTVEETTARLIRLMPKDGGTNGARREWPLRIADQCGLFIAPASEVVSMDLVAWTWD